MPDYTERLSVLGKKALITGGSKGIGAEVARVLADAGADIAIVGRDSHGLDETRRAVEAYGKECMVIEADLSTTKGASRAAQQALSHFGTIDILVNNAGIARINNLLELTADDWDETLAVNLRAPFILAQAVAPGMIAQRSGKIINISSKAGVVALEDHAAYSASKGGLNLLTKVMAVEWGPHNIQCNAVAPTVVMTPLGREVWGAPEKSEPMLAKIPLHRFGETIEVADLVLYLASPASNFISGQVILIDGGYTAL